MKNNVILMLASLFFSITPTYLCAESIVYTYCDSVKIEQQVEELLKQLTVEEKLSLLTGKDAINMPSVERLGIHTMRMKDGPNGVTNEKRATCFPTGITMASTWNPDLIEEMGAALGREAKDAGYHVILGPTVNIHRIALGGRNFESFSEDPFVAGKIGAAYTRGVQSEQVAVSVKHFATNNQEQNRHTVNSVVDERALREIYLPAFKRIVEEADPWTIMAAYNRLNGEFCCHNPFLLDQILKKEWGYKGLVVSDWAAVHGADAVMKGTDIEMPGPGHAAQKLEAWKKGEITAERLDENVRRILRVMMLTGAIGERKPTQDGLGAARNKAVARRVAEEGLVLLKNKKNVLPFHSKKIKTLAVIGPNAKEGRAGGLGSSKVEPEYIVTVWDALNKQLKGEGVELLYDKGCDFVEMPSIETKYLTTPDGKSGVKARYFNNKTMEGDPILECIEPNIDFDWAMDSPDASVRSDDFSAIYEANLVPPVSGIYKIGLTNNDGARLYIDGKLVIDNWNDLRLIDPKVVEVELEKGRSYSIKVEFFEWGVTAGVRLAWEIPNMDMIGDKLDNAIALAKKADAVVVVGGFSEYGEGEGADRRSIDLPGFQNRLIEEVAKVNPNTAVVLINGSNVSMPWIDKVNAVVEAWYPGQEGAYAISDALFGKINPSGKLTTSFIHDVNDNPSQAYYMKNLDNATYGEGLYVGYRHYEKQGTDVLFPFGHGLSYTQFKYDKLVVKVDKEALHVTLQIRNTGKYDGKEIVQVYVADKAAKIDRPLKELRAFQKVALKQGESKKVSLTIPINDLRYFDPATRSWKLDNGKFEVLVGASSQDIRLKKDIEIQ